MAQINCCLKRIFTVFNIFFAIVGGVIIGLALLSQIVTNAEGGGNLEGRTTGLIGLYVLGSATMVIAILGAYGAHKESKVSLIVFLVCMVIGSLMMLRAGIPAAIARPQLEGVLEEKFRQLLPLDKASDEVQEMADSMQLSLHCCGLFSYTDWEDNIPDSCQCTPVEDYECRMVRLTDLYRRNSKSIYSKPCFPIIMRYVHLGADILIGVVFFLAALALLGMMLSSIMIHQMRHPNRSVVLLNVPTIFSAAPPKYQELNNPPPPY
ncbi:tetraspanin-8-like [Odontesthes bonariensis]|uniref:tetraspanin-8-like n=1 Tax=Odontesthes bonariensis TaxID=219752 RepID=UPI003F58E5DD